MFYHRNSQRRETQRNITCPNLQCFGCNEGCMHLSLVSVQGETSGGDITGRFSGKGKLTFWKVLEDLTQTMTKYRHFYSFKWHNDHLKQPLHWCHWSIFCQLYLPHTDLKNVADARWWLFKKKESQYKDLPTPPPQKKLRFFQL